MGGAKQAWGPNCGCKIKRTKVLTEIKGEKQKILRIAELPIVPLEKNIYLQNADWTFLFVFWKGWGDHSIVPAERRKKRGQGFFSVCQELLENTR